MGKENNTRVCKKCNRELPLTQEYFKPRNGCKDGLSPICWECMGRKFGKRQLKEKWTDADINILKQFYENTTNEELIEKYFPNRTSSQITDYASKKLKLHKLKETTESIYWSKEEESFLIENYHNMTSSELCKHIGKTAKTIVHRANKLGLRKDNGSRLHPINEIADELRKNDIEIVEMVEEYNSRYSKFKIKCNKGHIHETSYNALYRIDFKCIYCNEENQEHGKFNYYDLIDEFKNKDYTPIFRPEDYSDIKSDLKFICNKHKEYGIQTTDFYSIRYNECSCKYCKLENKMGENSSNWRGGCSNINEFLRTCIYEWKKQSMINCNYMCVITGLKMDIIHHLYNFNKMADEAFQGTNIIKRANIAEYSESELIKLRDNIIKLHFGYGLGICLNDSIHKLFHKIYGSYDNNSQQFSEFKESYFKGLYDDELDEEIKSYNSIKRLETLKQVV